MQDISWELIELPPGLLPDASVSIDSQKEPGRNRTNENAPRVMHR